MRILNSSQMREADRHAIEEIGMPSLVLMENAAAESVRAMEDALGDLGGISVLVLCGMGNNGGDGMAMTRLLAAEGCEVHCLLFGDPTALRGDPECQWRILDRLHLSAEPCDEDTWRVMRKTLESRDIVVDALLGTGLQRELTGLLATVVNDLNASSVPVVAVDVPTGLSAESPACAGPHVEASLTVTFGAPKVCHVFAPSCEHCGDIVVADIGIPDESIDEAGSQLSFLDQELLVDAIEDLSERPDDSHKGSFGHVVVVGGSVGKSGAVALAGNAALTAGAGRVTVATPEPCVASVAAHGAELMQIALPAGASGELNDAAARVDEVLATATVLVIGPGLGTTRGAATLLKILLDEARVPVLLDADALTLVSKSGFPEPRSDRPLVLTPHPGEFSRLVLGDEAGEPPRHAGGYERIPDALRLSADHDATVVVKGFRTFLASPDGEVLVNMTGGPGLATAGTGDVLAGFLGGLLAQGLGPRLAAASAVFLHGRAGDLAEAELGQMALRAGDLSRFWPDAVRSVLAAPHSHDEDD